jgi:hypothetical protein
MSEQVSSDGGFSSEAGRAAYSAEAARESAVARVATAGVEVSLETGPDGQQSFVEDHKNNEPTQEQ